MGCRMTAGGAKSPDNITSTFFNTRHLLHKDLKLEHGGAKLSPCPERHLTSLRPWSAFIAWSVEGDVSLHAGSD